MAKTQTNTHECHARERARKDDMKKIRHKRSLSKYVANPPAAHVGWNASNRLIYCRVKVCFYLFLLFTSFTIYRVRFFPPLPFYSVEFLAFVTDFFFLYIRWHESRHLSQNDGGNIEKDFFFQIKKASAREKRQQVPSTCSLAGFVLPVDRVCIYVCSRDAFV